MMLFTSTAAGVGNSTSWQGPDTSFEASSTSMLKSSPFKWGKMRSRRVGANRLANPGRKTAPRCCGVMDSNTLVVSPAFRGACVSNATCAGKGFSGAAADPPINVNNPGASIKANPCAFCEPVVSRSCSETSISNRRKDLGAKIANPCVRLTSNMPVNVIPKPARTNNGPGFVQNHTTSARATETADAKTPVASTTNPTTNTGDSANIRPTTGPAQSCLSPLRWATMT
mmetsp:Transcript_23053/g.55969  ORF Transcript_23053/g.55969 Transcript_23053/m.55969 type:complete len:228 (-) Transcript_23053:25-708(-)